MTIEQTRQAFADQLTKVYEEMHALYEIWVNHSDDELLIDNTAYAKVFAASFEEVIEGVPAILHDSVWEARDQRMRWGHASSAATPVITSAAPMTLPTAAETDGIEWGYPILDTTDARAHVGEVVKHLQSLLETPPVDGYDDGWHVIAIDANNHPASYGDVPSPFGAEQDVTTAIDPDDPYKLQRAFVTDWEQLGTCIDAMTDTFRVEGMTQGFIVIRGKRDAL